MDQLLLRLGWERSQTCTGLVRIKSIDEKYFVNQKSLGKISCLETNNTVKRGRVWSKTAFLRNCYLLYNPAGNGEIPQHLRHIVMAR